MDKRYQVFVSSTYEDLREERQEVIQALLELDCIPTGMELFPATDEDSWTLIKDFIRQCDYYIVIVGGRYGSVNPATGKSYTQMEYEFATESGLPTVAFLHHDPGKLIGDKLEKTDAGKESLGEFRKLIESHRHCKYWSTAKELGGVVSRSISALKKTHPRTGWVRADRVPDENSAHEILRLRDEVIALEMKLRDAAHTPPSGSVDLAQGSEAVSVRFRFETSNEYHTLPFEFTWNKLLLVLGPVLLSPQDEHTMKAVLLGAWKNRYPNRGYNARIIDEDFHLIKIQFRALGYIAQSSPGVWQLTPYGDSVLMQLAAIPAKKVDKE
jgi:hypothetical protein